MYRLGHSVDGQWVEHSHAATFQLPEPGDRQRIVLGLPASDVNAIVRLARVLSEPLVLLYVLHTPRGEAQAGRYQSPDLSIQDVEAFLAEFKMFLAGDGRFDLWFYSPEERATIVWDRHNLVYAYGPLQRYEQVLRELGFTPGKPHTPVPHAHHYRSELDESASRVMGYFDWQYSPLRPEDEQ